MKLKFKLPKFSFRTITSIIFLLIIAAEILLTLNYLYNNLRPEDPIINDEKVLKADLKGYSQIYTDLNRRSDYAPQEFNYINTNPFQYGK